jgi:hypothetical protein
MNNLSTKRPISKSRQSALSFPGKAEILTKILSYTAVCHAPYHDISGPKVKSSHCTTWTPELQKIFEKGKGSLSRATLLAHLDTFRPLSLVTDASTSAMGTVLQQRVKNP